MVVSRRSLHALIAIVVGLLLLLFVIEQAGERDGRTPDAYLLPGFADDANGIVEIRIRRGDDEEVITLRRIESTWVVAERDDYPADVAQLRQLVNTLAGARIVERKTSDPARYDRLGVGDPAAGGDGSAIELLGDDFSYSVVFGKTAQGSYRYARPANDATSYLIDRNPTLPQSAGDWLAAAVIDIPATDVLRVSIVHADGERLVVERADDESGNFNVLDVPEGRELSYAAVGNGIAAALANLQLDDVRRSGDGAITVTTVIETLDERRVTAVVQESDDTRWVTFEIDGDEELAVRLDGWQFRLPDYKSNLLARRWDDVLKAAEGD